MAVSLLEAQLEGSFAQLDRQTVISAIGIYPRQVVQRCGTPAGVLQLAGKLQAALQILDRQGKLSPAARQDAKHIFGMRQGGLIAAGLRQIQ